ncbi:hypothetical protein ACFWUW_14255 [Streptomyces sp. NPDC058655]|uniref:hypothetical protein n=1 Tax=unclassified Streptomyces TaxID=2593676 RepID=UPI00365BFF4F
MNKRTRIILTTPLLACSLAIGPAAAAVWAATPQAVPSAACFVEAKPGDATKAIVTGEGFTKGTKVTVDQTDGAGGVLVTVAENGTFTANDQPAGKYTATQQGGAGLSATCLGGQQAQDAVNQKAIETGRQAGAKAGFTDGKALAQSGVCDAKPKIKPAPQGLAPDAAAQKAAKEAHDAAYAAAFDSALKRYCTD